MKPSKGSHSAKMIRSLVLLTLLTVFVLIEIPTAHAQHNKDPKECKFANIQFKYYNDTKCEKELTNFTKDFNTTFHDPKKNKYKPVNDCQKVDDKWSQWVCDDEQIKFVQMKDPNPITAVTNDTLQCSVEDDCKDCVVMDFQWEKCIKDDDKYLRVIGANHLTLATTTILAIFLFTSSASF